MKDEFETEPSASEFIRAQKGDVIAAEDKFLEELDAMIEKA